MAAFFPEANARQYCAHSDEFGIVPLEDLIEQRLVVPRLNLGTTAASRSRSTYRTLDLGASAAPPIVTESQSMP